MPSGGPGARRPTAANARSGASGPHFHGLGVALPFFWFNDGPVYYYDPLAVYPPGAMIYDPQTGMVRRSSSSLPRLQPLQHRHEWPAESPRHVRQVVEADGLLAPLDLAEELA
jgi:hypothetical protein